MQSRVSIAALAATAVLLLASSSAIKAQSTPGDTANPPWKAELSRLPTPRTPDGKPNLGGSWQRGGNWAREALGESQGLVAEGLSDEKGNVKASWGGRGSDSAQGFINYQRDTGVAFHAAFMPNMPLYRPQHWERVQWLDENGNFEDPEMVCKPMGVPRMGPPDRIVQTPKEFFFFYRWLYTFRSIPMNTPLPPVEQWEGLKWAGTSSARWEGETLVIESVDFSENSWIGSPGYFHSANMRVTERMTRQGNVLTWQATVNDPDVLLEPWVQNPWFLRLGNADAVGEPKEQEPCGDLSRQHFTLKERG